MLITVYAIKRDLTPDETRLGTADSLAQLGYPVSWTLQSTQGAREVTLDVADGAKVWEDRGKIWIDEGNNPGILRTFDGKATLTITGYYGDVNKPLRIMSIT